MAPAGQMASDKRKNLWKTTGRYESHHRCAQRSHSRVRCFWTGSRGIMSNIQVAMLTQQPYTLLRDAVFTHPTMTEGLVPLFARVPKQQDVDLEKR